MIPVNHSEVMIAYPAERCDPSGNLRDDKTSDLMRQLLADLVKLARKMK